MQRQFRTSLILVCNLKQCRAGPAELARHFGFNLWNGFLNYFRLLFSSIKGLSVSCFLATIMIDISVDAIFINDQKGVP